MKQGTDLIAKTNFAFRLTGARGRPVRVMVGDVFTVTTPLYVNERKGTAMIDRAAKARISCGYEFSLEFISENFEIDG